MSCKNQTNIDKYEMDVLSEGLYQMDEASNISIFKNNMYFCSGNTIISVDFNDILNQKMVYKNDSDILALTVNIDGIWIALDNGKIIQCDTDGSILKEYILFEKETNIYNIVVDQGSALLFTEDIIDDYRRTIIYQYDFNLFNKVVLLECEQNYNGLDIDVNSGSNNLRRLVHKPKNISKPKVFEVPDYLNN